MTLFQKAKALEALRKQLDLPVEYFLRHVKYQPPADRNLTRREVAHILGISIRQIYVLRKQGKLTARMMGSGVRFSSFEVEDLKNRKVEKQNCNAHKKKEVTK